LLHRLWQPSVVKPHAPPVASTLITVLQPYGPSAHERESLHLDCHGTTTTSPSIAQKRACAAPAFEHHRAH
jgi:hypothetical protein